MSLAMEWLKILLPWMAIFGLMIVFVGLVIWAKNKKASALLEGVVWG